MNYINDNGKKVSGSAAVLHFIYTVCGGIKEYNDMVGTQYIKSFVESNSAKIQEEIQANINRSNIKVG